MTKHMKQARLAVVRLAGAVALIAAGTVFAQGAYPNKPIRLIVPHAAGAVTDTLARTLAEHISRALGQPLVIENRPGANTAIGSELVARAPADGYTILMGTAAGVAANPGGLARSMRFDPAKDLTPISHVGAVSYVLLAGAALTAQNMAELVAQARANPGKLNYASGNLGGIVYMGMLVKAAAIEMVHVPYKSTPPAMVDLLGGRVDAMVSDLTSALPLIRGGKLRALAVTATKRSAIVPSVPTLAESGINIRQVPGWLGIYGPGGLPAPIVEVLNREINAALRKPEVLERAAGSGLELAGSTPAELAAYTREQTELWRTLIREFDIPAQD